MILVILMVLWGGDIISAQEVKVKGGALIQEMGKANLINKIVIVKKNFTEVNFLRGKAVEMEDRLSHIMISEKDDENKKILKNMRKKLSEITGSRKRRSLLPFVGNALNQLFGVATESDVQKERERLDKIEEWANNLGNIIQGTVGVLNDHAMIINNISESLNVLSEKVEETISGLERQLIYQDMALKIDEIVNDVRFKMEALLEAKLNRVSVNLLSFKELEEVISYSIVKFLMKPLEIDLITYYNVMSVKVVHDQVYIFLPFDDEKNLLVFRVIPFPMRVTKKEIILDSEVEIILEKERLDLVALKSKQDFDYSCVEIKEREFVCNFDVFYTQHIHNIHCVNYLLNNGEDDCEYKLPSNDLEVKLLGNNLYVYTKEKENSIVTCAGNEQRVIVENVHVFPRQCYIKITNKLYYEPTIFKEVKINETFQNYGLKLNTTHLKLPKFMNKAESMNYVNFWFTYKKKVMPIMSLIYFPLFVIIGIVVILVFRNVIMKKINKIFTILSDKVQNQTQIDE